MTEQEMIEAKTALKGYLTRLGIGRGKGIAALAEMLHVSPYTVEAWLKPMTTRSALPAPKWALEVLARKMPAMAAALKRTG
jgi:hypothetical protein